jgi:glucosylceramidase
MFRFIRAKLVLLACCPALLAQTVQVYQTTPDPNHPGNVAQTLQQQSPLTFTSSGTASQTITVNDAKTYQQMDGFGAAMTDASAWVLYTKLSTDKRNEAMTKLFDRTNGIALRFIRIPMGSSDESVTVYSYDDLCTPSVPTAYCTTPNGSDGKMLSDPTLAKFSIAHDEAYIIPALQQARDIAVANNERIKFMANPWSPPGWMKTNGSMLGVANGITGTLKPEAYDPLAQYFVKFVQGYAADGLHIDYISVQNEPQYAPGDYSGLLMSATDQANFLANNIGPAFQKANIDAKFMVWDHNWDNLGFPEAVLNNAASNKLAAGVAWHHYAGDPSAMTTVHDLYPDKDVWETEASMVSTDSLSRVGLELINSTRNWAKSYVLWDLANDQNMGPHVGGCGTCRPVVTVDYSDPSNVVYKLTTDYYALGQASKFVVPGAYRIDSDQQISNGLYDVAFRNPDGSIVVYVTNTGSSDQTFNLKYSGNYVTATVKAGSIATYVWSPATPSTVALSQQPNGLTVGPSQGGMINVTLTPLTGTPNVVLSCAVIDASGTVITNYTCTPTQSTFAFSDSTPQSTSITLTPVAGATGQLRRNPEYLAALFGLSGLPMIGIVVLGTNGRRRWISATALVAAVAFVLTSCGGGGGSTGGGTIPPPPIQQQVATPTLSVGSGTYSGPQSLTISDSTAGATIYYTQDGSFPSTSSTKYSGPITIASTQTVKTIASASGYMDSTMASATYNIGFSILITATPDNGAPFSITVPVTVR